MDDRSFLKIWGFLLRWKLTSNWVFWYPDFPAGVSSDYHNGSSLTSTLTLKFTGLNHIMPSATTLLGCPFA